MQTPSQWLNAFLNVHPYTLSTAQKYRDRILKLNQIASHTLENEIKLNIENNSSRTHKHVRYSWNNQQLIVKLRKGFTCTNAWFLHFLETNFCDNAANIHYDEKIQEGSATVDDNNDVNAKLKDSGLQTRALMIDVVVESGYGTKVLYISLALILCT
jgi:hypothetical protein